MQKQANSFSHNKFSAVHTTHSPPRSRCVCSDRIRFIIIIFLLFSVRIERSALETVSIVWHTSSPRVRVRVRSRALTPQGRIC